MIVSPTAVSCNGDPKYANDIYVKNMPKGPYHQHFDFHGEVNMFGELSNEKHLACKKIVQGLYLKSAVFNAKNTTRRSLSRNISQLVKQVYLTSVCGESKNNNDSHQPEKLPAGIDMHSLFAALGMDVVSAFELGDENGTQLLQNPDQRLILNSHRKVFSMVFWTTRMFWLWNCAAGPGIRAAAKEIDQWQLGLYKHAEQNVPQRTGTQNLTTLETLKKNGITGREAYSNISDNLIAGHDTTAVELTHTCVELSKPANFERQARLKAELLASFGEPGDLDTCIDNLEEIDRLPYLEAVIQETLRFHVSTSGLQPRITDKFYQVKINGKTISLPPGIEISCQGYLMHRVALVFPDPDRWIPERWLQKETETQEEYTARIREMQRYMMPFGKGIRMCLGLSLAMIEVKMTLANLYWRYKLSLFSEWDAIKEADIGEKNEFIDKAEGETTLTKVETYVSRPYFEECWLRWSQV